MLRPVRSDMEMAQNWHKNSALVRACSGFTWRVSDCEELSGGYSREMMEVGFSGLFFYHFPTTTQVNILKIVPVMIV